MDNIRLLDSLDLSENISTNWQCWKQSWQLYTKASSVAAKSEDVQCAIFLHMIGEEALRIFNTFTFTDEDKDKLNLIIEKFDAHCNPKKNVTYERYIFNTCTQNGRSFDAFLIDVVNKAKSCDFLTLYDGLIRDRLVCGIDSTKTKKYRTNWKRLSHFVVQ